MKRKTVGWILSVSLIVQSLGCITGAPVYALEKQEMDEISCLEQTDDLMKEEVEQISLEAAEQLDEKFVLQKEKESTSYSIKEEKINTDVNSTYGYEQLNTTQKKCYDTLVTEAERFHKNFLETVSKENKSGETVYLWGTVDLSSYGWTDITDFRKVLFALGADHPQYFWFTCNFSYAMSSNGLITKAYLNAHEDYATVSSRKTAQENIEVGMEEYLTAIDEAVREGVSDLALELLIHDKIIENIDYKYSSGTTPSDDGSAHSITGVFDKTGVVCEGYAKSFQLLANYAGLESIYAVGYGNGGGHAWNLINIGGEWYNLDVTWDDMNKSATTQRQMVYTWFNCSTDKFAKHSYQPSVFPGMYDVPSTTADTYNYYTYYDLYVKEEDVESSEKISKLLERALEKAKEKKDFHLQFSCENSRVMNTLMTGISSTLVKGLSDDESYYYTDGAYSYSTSNGYYVFKNICCAYLPENVTYYDGTAATVLVNFYDGKQKKNSQGNYSLTYSDNEQVGEASVLFQGIGDYAQVGSYTFRYTVEDAGKAPTSTPTPTNTPTPTITNTPTPSNTVTPTVTIKPSNTVTPTVTIKPSNTVTPTVTVTDTVMPTATVKPTGAVTPTATVTDTVMPTATVKPTGTVTPTAAPTDTVKPTATVRPTGTVTVTVRPTNTIMPTTTTRPTSTLTPSATTEPTNTLAPSVTKTVSNAPSCTKAPTPTKSVCYQVTYKGNGGKINKKSTYSLSKEKDEKLSQLPQATRAGYVFLGWYTQKTGGNKVSKNFKVTGNITLYAHWLKIPDKAKVTLKQTGEEQVKISWKKIKGVSYYKVYRSNTKNGTYKLLKKTKQLSYLDKNKSKGRRYYYYVESYSVDGKIIGCSKSSKKSIKMR